jgi:hypothetical protein
MRFIAERDIADLKQFDISYGTRRFPTTTGRRLLYPWQGDDGFYTWLDNLFRPVLEYNLRREFGRFDCAELVASCSLVRSGRSNSLAVASAPAADAGTIANRISVSLDRDLARTLGRRYFWNIRMRISRVTLPGQVQTAINVAQTNYVKVNTAQAQLKQADYQYRRNHLLGKAYNESPGLAYIDALKALPKQATVILSTNGQTPTILANPGTGSSVEPTTEPSSTQDSEPSTEQPDTGP